MSNGPLGPFDAPDSSGGVGPRDRSGPQDSVRGRPGYGRPDAGPAEPAGPYGDAGGAAGGRFSAFPFPSYTTRTRSGTQVSVGGCCLPLPIGCLVLTLSAGGLAAARFVQSRR